MDYILGTICLYYLVQVCLSQSQGLRGPPRVEKNPKLSGSYIPAAMQIIAHDTELMKYVINPPPGPTIMTTTTMRPTPPHRPAVYAPSKPLGPTEYFLRTAEYVQHQQQPSDLNHFDKYYPFVPSEDGQTRNLENENKIYDDADKYFGKEFGQVLRLANKIDSASISTDEDAELLVFSKMFEDENSVYRYELLRQKRVPPTKAYVTLLSLYNLLEKESKSIFLNKYAGYTDEVLDSLLEFSSSTSSYQLRAVLNKIVQDRNTKKDNILTKIKTLIADLDEEKSYINEALKDIPPLEFSP